MTLDDKTKYRPAERFSGLADKYALGRPSYPKAAIDFIVEHCRLKVGSTIADIGSGTGISSRLFAELNMQVTGIEPNKDMRQQAIKESLNHAYPKPQYLTGTAEETELANGSVDLVICAQSFHWFNPDKSLAEFHRILKAKGWLALLWNERDNSDAFTHDYSQLLQRVPDAAGLEMKRRQAGEVLLNCPLFWRSKKILFPNRQTVDEGGMLNRAFSTSYTPHDPEAINQFTEKLRSLFAQHQTSGTVIFVYTTSVYLAQRSATTE